MNDLCKLKNNIVKEKKILFSNIEPPNKEWLWYKVKRGIPSLNGYVGGKWVSISGDGNATPTPSPAPTPSDFSNYVTRTDLDQVRTDVNRAITNAVSGFVKQSDITQAINVLSTNIASTYASKNWVTTELGSYQKQLSAGSGVSIENDTISFDYEFVVKNTIIPDDTDAVSGGAVASALDELSDDIDDREYKLRAGTGITLDTETDSQTGKQVTKITATGGGSDGEGGSSVYVVNNGTSVPSDTDDLYFFSRSPQQVEGLYNNLLRNGVENDITFSPRTLYSLDEECGFSVVNNASSHITVQNNKVYCDGEPTGWNQFGELVLSNTIKYADTSDTAYISFMVTSPFYAAQTSVIVTYDTSVVRMERLVSNKNWSSLPNNGSIVVKCTDAPMEYMLRVVRKNADINILSALNTTVTFKVGPKSYPVLIKFSQCRLYFKNGVGYNGFNPSNPPVVNEALYTGTTGCDYTEGNKYIYVGSGKKYCCFAKNVSVNESQFNVLYAVVTTVSNSWFRCATFWPQWGGRNHTKDEKRLYNSTEQSNIANANTNIAKSMIARLGSFVLECYIHNVRVGNTVNLDLLVSRAGSGGLTIYEVGLLTYDTTEL